MKHTPSIFLALTALAQATVTIDYVTVGNAGNAADPATGSLYGAVAYEYKIAKNETTIAQYAEFLNAVAKSDTYGLYSTFMTTDLNVAGISRSGTSGSYSYTVLGSGDRPITYISWYDAARFCNWLHNGQQTGVGAALTAETGAYTLNGATSGIIAKNVGATVWIPTENEWYKAAYYDPTKNGGTGGYWLHANQNDTMTSNNIGVPGAANYYAGDYAVTQSSSYSSSQNYLTDVGAYGVNSDSYYGTNDQAGNVTELNDEILFVYDTLGAVVRGGSFNFPVTLVGSSNRGYAPRSVENPDLGFRIATVPEPSGLGLAVLSSALLLVRRRN